MSTLQRLAARVLTAPAMAPLLVSLARRWVRAERRRHLPHAHALGPAERDALAPHVDGALLDAVRIRDVATIDGPPVLDPFVAGWQALGLTTGPSLSQAAGITYGDLVLVSRRKASPEERIPLLFHELVHVRQYAEHGIDGFLDRYLRDWIAHDLDYWQIPFEVEAYAEEAAFREAWE